MHKTFKLAAIAAALLGSALAQAAPTTYSATQIESGSASGATFTAAGGSLVLANKWGVQAVGVSGGRTSDEIDIGQSITASFKSAVHVNNFRLAFLYDGPEFGDVQEKAKITVSFADLSKKSYTLTALYPNSYAWTGLGTVTNPNPNTDVNGGLWTVSNPFGNKTVSSISFTAVTGICGAHLRCDNQSDFALKSLTVSPVPEPETYALMIAGLGAVGVAARRRKAAR